MNTSRPEERQTASDPTITGSKALIESFLHEGVTTLFGYPGGAIIPVYDALYDYRDRLRHILVRHEQGAVHAAQGYARVSGQVGVDQLAGPVGMAEVMADTAKYSMISFFQLVAFISINLGVMNLLPLPALDGGRLVFLIIEGIRRKPVPPRYEGYVHAAGLMLLLMLMVYVTGQDVLRIFMRSN